jgi:hypothetical protein
MDEGGGGREGAADGVVFTGHAGIPPPSACVSMTMAMFVRGDMLGEGRGARRTGGRRGRLALQPPPC